MLPENSCRIYLIIIIITIFKNRQAEATISPSLDPSELNICRLCLITNLRTISINQLLKLPYHHSKFKIKSRFWIRLKSEFTICNSKFKKCNCIGLYMINIFILRIKYTVVSKQC